jgi:hypothetical protein
MKKSVIIYILNFIQLGNFKSIMTILKPNDFYATYLKNKLSYYGMYVDFENAKSSKY